MRGDDRVIGLGCLLDARIDVVGDDRAVRIAGDDTGIGVTARLV